MESLSALVLLGVCLQLFSSQDKLVDYKPLGHFRRFFLCVRKGGFCAYVSFCLDQIISGK